MCNIFQSSVDTAGFCLYKSVKVLAGGAIRLNTFDFGGSRMSTFETTVYGQRLPTNPPIQHSSGFAVVQTNK